MTWLNNGAILQIDSEIPDNPISIVTDKLDEEFVESATTYAKIYNLLIQDPIKANEACDKYSSIFEEKLEAIEKLNVEDQEQKIILFCLLSFNIIKLCFFTPQHKSIRSQLIKLFKYIRLPPTDNNLINLLCDLFDPSGDFSSKYIQNGGSDSILQMIIQYNETATTEKWIAQINQEFQNSHSQFDETFCKFIDERLVTCDNYLLSIFLMNFLKYRKTTPKNLLDTALEIQVHSLKTSPLETKFFWFVFHQNFAKASKYVFQITSDTLFSVHLLHLLTLKDGQKDVDLKKELDFAILRYVEFVISDYDSNDDEGLKKWVPYYLNIVNDGADSAAKKVLPSIENGLEGSYIEKIKKMPNFVFVDNNEFLSLFHDIENLVHRLSSSEEYSEADSYDEENAIFKEIVQSLNKSYIKCNDKMKSEILLQLTPFLERLDGLSGSVISSMIDIGNSYSKFNDNDPCPALQKMLYDIILEAGDIPEYLIK